MNLTKLKVNTVMLYLFIMTLPSVYVLYTYGRVGILIATMHLILSLSILVWYTRAVLAR